MMFRVAYLFAAFTSVLTHYMILPVKGQSTLHDCDNADSSVNIVAEIQQLFVEAIRQQQNQQVQCIHETLNSSFQQTIMARLQVFDRRSEEQLQGIKNLNASFQQMRNQHSSILKRLDEVAELLLDHDISTKNQTQNLCTSGMEATPRPKTLTDSGNDSTALPSFNNWTIIMNRFDGSVNFNRSWIEYKNGFGDIGRGEFWLGNEKVSRLTTLTTRSGFAYSLRIEVQSRTTGVWYNADYDSFSLDSEANKYALRLSGFSGGNARDSLTNITLGSAGYLGGMSFTTWDNDNDRYSDGNCASSTGGGWWFNACRYACLTCEYSSNFYWYSLHHLSSDADYYLRAARMMIKSK